MSCFSSAGIFLFLLLGLSYRPCVIYLRTWWWLLTNSESCSEVKLNLDISLPPPTISDSYPPTRPSYTPSSLSSTSSHLSIKCPVTSTTSPWSYTPPWWPLHVTFFNILASPCTPTTSLLSPPCLLRLPLCPAYHSPLLPYTVGLYTHTILIRFLTYAAFITGGNAWAQSRALPYYKIK